MMQTLSTLQLRLRERLTWRSAVVILLVYLAALAGAWHFTSSQVVAEAEREIAAARQEASSHVGSLSQTIVTNLRHLHGIAAIIAADHSVREMATRAGADPTPMNARLAEFTAKVNLGVIWLLNEQGVCVAASNAGSPESFVGIDYRDRLYYRDAREGRHGFQYAVGRKSNLPGLFFSAPVKVDGTFVGAVIVKIDLPTVPWVRQTDAYLYDQLGVVILSHEPTFERRVVQDAIVMSLPQRDRAAIYKQDTFQKLDFQIVPRWSSGKDTVLQRGQLGPMLVEARGEIPGYGLGLASQRELLVATNERAMVRKSFFIWWLSLTLAFVLAYASVAYIVSNKRVERKLEAMAFLDPLTGLVNRRLLRDRIECAVASAKRRNVFCALLYLDLDDFKDVNDQSGHDGGDIVLRTVAHRLKTRVRAVDTVARLGGDEFVLLLDGIGMSKGEAEAHAMQVADKIRAVLNKPHALPVEGGKRAFICPPSIGIHVFGPTDEDVDELSKRADEAMYEAKAAGKNAIVLSGSVEAKEPVEG